MTSWVGNSGRAWRGNTTPGPPGILRSWGTAGLEVQDLVPRVGCRKAVLRPDPWLGHLCAYSPAQQPWGRWTSYAAAQGPRANPLRDWGASLWRPGCGSCPAPVPPSLTARAATGSTAPEGRDVDPFPTWMSSTLQPA